MNEYVGKICPFCKTEITENDEIVVCSSCDMPHHKDCWIENQGCTTFGCMGTIKAVTGSVNSVTSTEISYEDTAESQVFCTKCGTKNSTKSSFCTSCGNPLRTTSSAPVYQQANPANTNPYAYTQQSQNPQPAYTPPQQNAYNAYSQQNFYSQNQTSVDPDVAALVGTKQEYYLPKFQEMKAQNKKTSWNWAAFFFAPYWLIYRKMYVYGFAALGLAFLVSMIKSPVVAFLSLGAYIAIGVLGNYIYMEWLEKLSVQTKPLTEPFKTQFVQKNGGVNGLALGLTIAAWVLLSIIMNA